MTTQTEQFQQVIAYGMRPAEVSQLIGVCVDDGWGGEGWYGGVSPGVFVGPCASRDEARYAIRESEAWYAEWLAKNREAGQ